MPYQNLNPNYFAQYPQLFQPQNQNPYLQRMENLQQFQQTINPAPVQSTFTAMGKMVESIDMVKATDIPMDGSTYYFPKADGSMVFTKRWLPNGTTEVTSYKPYLEENEPKSSNVSSEDIKTQFGAFCEVLEGIQNDLKVLNDKVDRISKPEKAKKGGYDE
jgi:hypothetical protein